ncbi:MULTISPECIES: hypothetical protein [Clostridium]|uniref:hypothetical protein n=1 Tax=Clostridium TaxID=1485 RepID=UPI00069E9EBD|nr:MULTISPECIES: hypothetical protein [Clostridium]KOF56498.1 hypothetical protein AGR56_06885 [Clostridium sp. DMHC 10]MCD2346116.1 hypothetical protein [Clostridium guangxiense]
MEDYVNYIYGGLGFIIGLMVPVVVTKVRIELNLVKGKIGDEKYNECKKFLMQLAELHPEDFAENKIVDLLDKLDNKYGDHLSKTQIKEIVDFVAKTIETDIIKEITK